MVVAGIIQILMEFSNGESLSISFLCQRSWNVGSDRFHHYREASSRSLNVDPSLAAGKGPLALFAAIPSFFAN